MDEFQRPHDSTFLHDQERKVERHNEKQCPDKFKTRDHFLQTIVVIKAKDYNLDVKDQGN